MTSRDNGSLEDQILETFLENITTSDDISEEIVDVIEALAGEADFGGREQLQERVQEVKGLDAD